MEKKITRLWFPRVRGPPPVVDFGGSNFWTVGWLWVCATLAVVLGGGMVEAMPDLFVSEVGAAARRTVLPVYEKTFKVKVAELGDDAAVRGAAAWCRACTADGVS